MTTEQECPGGGLPRLSVEETTARESEELERLRRKVRLLEAQNALLTTEMDAMTRELARKPKADSLVTAWVDRIVALEQKLNGDRYTDGLEGRYNKRLEEQAHAQRGTTNTVAMLQTRIEEVYQLCREEITALRAQMVQGGPTRG